MLGSFLFANLFYKLAAIMEAVDEGLVFISRADPAAEVEYRIVITSPSVGVMLTLLPKVCK